MRMQGVVERALWGEMCVGGGCSVCPSPLLPSLPPSLFSCVGVCDCVSVCVSVSVSVFACLCLCRCLCLCVCACVCVCVCVSVSVSVSVSLSVSVSVSVFGCAAQHYRNWGHKKHGL